MKVLYFAWVRQRVGIGEEDVDLPETVKTVEQLIGWLKSRGAEYEGAFENVGAIRAAVDQSHARLDADITEAQEVAFFPPVTGG